jgi:hypothetical protein
MSDTHTNWTKEELSAYILLYCANANFEATPEEIRLIRSKVRPSKYQSIHDTFEQDNDYQSAQKIQAAVTRLGLSEREINTLLEEMKALFFADGDFEAAEKTIFLGLRHILKAE